MSLAETPVYQVIINNLKTGVYRSSITIRHVCFYRVQKSITRYNKSNQISCKNKILPCLSAALDAIYLLYLLTSLLEQFSYRMDNFQIFYFI